MDIGEYYPQTQEVGLTAGAQGNIFGGGDHEVWSSLRVISHDSDHNHVYRLTG